MGKEFVIQHALAPTYIPLRVIEKVGRGCLAKLQPFTLYILNHFGIVRSVLYNEPLNMRTP